MIEHPEAVLLARQIGEELSGSRVVRAIRGNSPHKWVFYNLDREPFERILEGKEVGESSCGGKWVDVGMEPGYTLQFGDLGGRIRLHDSADTLPRKHHLLLELEGGRFFTITVQNWGFLRLTGPGAPREEGHRETGLCPTNPGFTTEYLARQVGDFDRKKSVKEFIVSGPAIAGLGNGYLQDVLFRAGIVPTRKLFQLSADDIGRLHRAIAEVMSEAIAADGRDTEYDLHDRPGRYVAAMDRRADGNPCPVCGTPILRVSYLGASCYFCPTCQT
ncbi:hypothetical protein JW921_02220 [Candidatus Fermentibacterales bacterium]|nr:hypothetical protein [Candidatus Fermentibacterales bacterium]